jgi:hypothetical protein
MLSLVLASACSRESGYKLTSYKAGNVSTNKSAEITLRHDGQTIRAECDGVCTEYGTMLGQNLSCFVEPPPSDPSNPYETKRPIFNEYGGRFVCNAGKGKAFMVRHYKCLTESPEDRVHTLQLRAEYPEQLALSDDALDKRYCKPGETLIDQGRDTIDKTGRKLPENSVELLTITEAEDK